MVESVILGDCTLYLGDCLEILPMLPLEDIDAIITDPPYGENIGKMGFTTNVNGGVTLRNDYKGLAEWDASPVNLLPFLSIGKVRIIWGGNFYTDILPISRGWLIWDKKNSGQYSNDFADCEMAWTNLDQPTRLIKHVWHGMIQQSMRNKETRYHPTQKPIAVMKWCIEQTDVDLIFDPFMGSGTTGIACVQTKRKFIGIEINPRYFDIAVKRIKQAQLQIRMEI